MAADLFAALMLGHLTGDYLLQNKWMALRKDSVSWICAVHCAVYTLCVVALTWPILHGWVWTALVFASHFVIDRWSLAERWLKFIGSRSLLEFIRQHIDHPIAKIDFAWVMLQGAFTALVYAVADNTMHLLLMYYGGCWLLTLDSLPIPG